MDADHRDLVQHLFALATAIAEAAHETAASGQASALPAVDLVRAADALDRHGADLQAIAGTIAVAARIDAAESHEKPS